MNEDDLVIEAFETRAQRRHDRRALFTAALGAAAVGSAFVYADPAKAQTAVTDADVLNFALNLEYLEAQFYLYAVNGTGLPSTLTGSGSAAGGTVTGGAQVDFSGDTLVGAYAREIAADEQAHVNFLRTALGSSAVAMPNINISGAADGPFTAAARAAGVVDSTSGVFNPYADPTSFLLGAYIFEDVGVTAYKGAAPLLSNKTFLEAAAGILAVEAYHAAIVRTTLYAKGVSALVDATEKISAARDALDGSPTEDQIRGIAPKDDFGIMPSGSGDTLASNIAPLNANGLAYSRSTGQVLNIVYLNAGSTTMGGFFPNGVNGNIRSTT
ncbi:ferritin-like domain-containing protein [Sphingomonas yunnanensis]|uniref:ferritin-like domain-containing protein n=1 Tax=Sphingomonas yunnanensis TaxID=310400 RepID=UPI001CA661EB|nr:ferritin-like domain-containing protein [Sphingomonas yunnanensis]MBY9063507.1 ferritin-like domain-containing protein [Sphingomonas yunnanensis]